MDFLTWTDEFSVGLQRLDIQHKRIVALTNEFLSALKCGKGRDVVGKALGDLVNYARTYLKGEEKIISKGER